ncbi:Pentatricopeptide repeat-containing protein [Thalictrum thalictroides]|uniref:Pentatricopeptide repeat-containing protein n=1 Tax=Thalictrum thalictroides TaxID=46969 RepID=A0A7J6X0Q1_THATH|nr:Pentatricopeptide repeat-containing protein [Thalictrum thalictroides]
MIDGYTRGNRYAEALRFFSGMMSIDGLKPTDITILTVLPAVYNFGDLSICQSIHAYGEKTGFSASDIRVMNSLIDAYAKCGCMKNAYKVFQEIHTKRKNLVSWTSVISGFAMHGMAKEALELFEGMEEENLRANQITFLSVLNACSHGGLMKEGVGFFKKMVDEYHITPNIKHYGCMIDMLGRAGMLEEAEKIALDIPSEMVNVVVWRILLGACSFHGNAEMGERVLRKILKIERGYAGDYVLLSNILTGVGRFGEAGEVRTLMDEMNVLKVPGLCFINSVF